MNALCWVDQPPFQTLFAWHQHTAQPEYRMLNCVALSVFEKFPEKVHFVPEEYLNC